MNRRLVFTVLMLLVGSVLPATAQGKPDGPWIRLANFAPDSPPVAVYVNGKALLTSVNYPSVSGYIALGADQLRNVVDTSYSERSDHSSGDDISAPTEWQYAISLMVSPIRTHNPLDIPHIERPGYIFVDGLYARDTMAHQIDTTIRGGHYYSITIIGQQGDDSVQAVLMDDTIALVAVW